MQDIEHYRQSTRVLLAAIKLDTAVLSCNDMCCHNLQHLEVIDKLYEGIVESLLKSSDTLACSTRKGYSQVPGWNDVCKEDHRQARDAFLMWVSAGKPHSGILFDTMKSTRAHFKLTLRQCRANVKEKYSDSLAKKTTK